MKIAFIFFTSIFWMSAFAQPIKTENLIHSKKESKIIFDIDPNVFRVVSEEKVLKIEYDKRLSEAMLKGDSLFISPKYNKSLQKLWQEMGNALKVSFLTKSTRHDITFNFRKLPLSVPSLTPQLGDSTLDRNSVLAFRKVKILAVGCDPEEFFKHYNVKHFEILLNNKSFFIEGEALSEEVLVAIVAAKPGDEVALQKVESFNGKSNQKLTHVNKTIYVLR